MKLKNSVIIALVQQGISATTAHEVPVKDAYKAFRFKNAVEKANKAIDEKRPGLIKEAGIEDGQKVDDRIKELRAIKEPTEEQQKELEEMVEKLKKFNELYTELLKDESELEGVKTMPYESYHALAKENKDVNKNLDIFEVFAGELEGVLWVAPKEEE